MSEGLGGGVTTGARQLIMEGRAGISAPLLAGFSLALVGVIAQDPTHFRWPGVALAALMIPIFCFLGAIRAGYRTKSALYMLSDSAEAETKLPDQGKLRTQEPREDRHHGSYLRWGYLTFFAFGAGLFSLWVCIALTVAPPTPGGQEAAVRWVAFAMAIAASIFELAILVAAIPHRKDPSVTLLPARDQGS